MSVARQNDVLTLRHEILPLPTKKLQQILAQFATEHFVFGTILNGDFRPSLR